jgi:hypothetical protein
MPGGLALSYGFGEHRARISIHLTAAPFFSSAGEALALSEGAAEAALQAVGETSHAGELPRWRYLGKR